MGKGLSVMGQVCNTGTLLPFIQPLQESLAQLMEGAAGEGGATLGPPDDKREHGECVSVSHL